MQYVDRRGGSGNGQRHSSRSFGLHVLGISVLALAALPTVVDAYDGRRMTLGANRPLDDIPSVTVPYDQSAAMPSYPPLSRPADAIQPALMPSTPSTVEAAPVRVTPGPGGIDAPKPSRGMSQTDAALNAPGRGSAPATAKMITADASAKVTVKADVTVSAPAARATARDGQARVEAPGTRVDVRESGRVRVAAPMTRVAVDEGRVRVKAPFVDLDIRF